MFPSTSRAARHEARRIEQAFSGRYHRKHRRSVDTLHREIHTQVVRDFRRINAGRYCWNPKVRMYFDTMGTPA